MEITYDEVKRQKTLIERGIDFADAKFIFKGMVFHFEDTRIDYGEKRTITVGFLKKRMFIVVWTTRENTKRIISMRKANDKEQLEYNENFRKRRFWLGF